MEGTELCRKLMQRQAVVLGVVVILLLSRGEACSGTTCSQCISYGADCAWCADANFTEVAGERCGRAATLEEEGCVNIQSPTTEEHFTRNANVTDGNDAQGTDAIQLQPQEMYIKLRPRGKGHNFDVTFRPADNFPVDLYFLFDLSKTMQDYIQDLSSLASGMADEIGKISKNYRMGYGTFQDKVLLPFTSTHPAKLANPCPAGNKCAAPFDFRHELDMTSVLKDFTAAVNNSQTTGNIDTPEGGFDAIMQAIVCKTVGWRDNSRQIIIFASDAGMHFAGDGKLAGLVTPNDGQCHLEGKINPMAKTQDYPSVGQISAALDKSKKYVIFAVKEAVLDVYEKLHSRVPRSSVNLLKKGDESNVVDIVRDKYREMTKGVKLEYTTSSKNIRVSITPTCDHREGSSCTNIVIGEKVKPFVVNVRAESCPENRADRIQNVVIAPSDFLKDRLNITVELLCDCDCEQATATAMDPTKCTNGNGTVECGICRCHEGRFGSNCECDQKDIESRELTCFSDEANSTNTPECNGLGECRCGQCHCKPNFSGRYCQCNNKVCPIFDGLVCAGNGVCPCEDCQCNANFTGLACECPTSTETCVAEGQEDGKICSGHGRCECGSCVCDGGYLGRHCQTCFRCGTSLCELDNHKECAACKVLKDRECPEGCPHVEVVREEDLELPARQVQHAEGEKPIAMHVEECQDWRTEDCHVKFVVHNDGNNVTIRVLQVEVCTEGPDILLIVLGVVGGVVGVGLILLLLIKLLTGLFDHLEYQHFVKELQSPKWAKYNNPLYVHATTTYHNPNMYKD